MQHSPYLKTALTEMPRTFETAMAILQPREHDFDGIVCTGVSGLIIAPLLALQLDKRLAVVRKTDDQMNHAVVRVESGLKKADRWIFVDDLIASGATITRVEDAMRRLDGFDGPMVGHYLYNAKEFTQGSWT